MSLLLQVLCLFCITNPVVDLWMLSCFGFAIAISFLRQLWQLERPLYLLSVFCTYLECFSPTYRGKSNSFFGLHHLGQLYRINPLCVPQTDDPLLLVRSPSELVLDRNFELRGLLWISGPSPTLYYLICLTRLVRFGSKKEGGAF